MSESIFSIDFAARPEIVALGTLIIGFIVARMASAGVGLGLSALDKRTARVATTEASVLSPRLITFVRSFVFWLFLIFAVAVALQLLGLGGMSAILDVVIAFIPQALVGFIIVVAGHLIGLLVRNLVTHLDTTLTADSFVPRLLHGVIVVVAVVMGLQQVNVDITFVTRLILILVAVTGSGLVIAFALGARQHVANLMAHREIARLAIGEQIRIDDTEGKVVEIHSTGVDIATEEGIASIPASRFAETRLLRIRRDDKRG